MTEIQLNGNICRVCLTESESLTFFHLWKTGKILGEITKLGIMLNFVSSLDSKKSDGLPEKLCKDCVIQVSKAYTFKQQCLKADLILKDKFKDIDFIENSKNDKQSNTEENYDNNFEQIVNVKEEQQTYEDDKSQIELIQFLDNPNSEIVEKEGDEDDKELMIEKEEINSDSNKTDNEIDIDTETGDIPKMVFKKLRTRSTRNTQQTQYKCNICSKTLRNSSSYKYHMQLHSEENKFLCSQCGQSFKTKNAYDGHMITHNKNNPHTCHVCSKSYRQAASLRCHMLSHSGFKPFLCGICGKGMTQKSGFKKHMLIHSNVKPHTCEICGKDFRYSSNLIMHKRGHNGEKNYACNLCDKRFTGVQQLKRHSFIHSGEKPFSCEFCGRCFNRKSTLRVHTYIHTEEKRHSCQICGKSYIQLHCLNTHMATHRT